MMNELKPQDLVDLVAKITEINHQLIVGPRENVLTLVSAAESTLSPWYNYLKEVMPMEASIVTGTFTMFKTYDTTRQEVINALENISKKITEFARTWALELCIKNITDTFCYFKAPADAAALSAAIDEVKNRCLQERLSPEEKEDQKMFRPSEDEIADYLD